jgi:divalent metal cation (Fe/Co/Zn/Cd) transporter
MGKVEKLAGILIGVALMITGVTIILISLALYKLDKHQQETDSIIREIQSKDSVMMELIIRDGWVVEPHK